MTSLTYRVGFVDNWDSISVGRPSLKAPRQFIVLGTYHVLITICYVETGCEAYSVEAYTLQANLSHEFCSLYMTLRIL